MAYDQEKGKDMSTDTDAFADSLEVLDHDDGYLGDPEYIGAMLHLVITEAMTGPNNPDGIMGLARGVAKVLLGLEGKEKPVVGWNEPGGIDEFAAKWCGVDETDPVLRMTGAVLRFIDEVCAVGDYASQPGVTNDQWQFQIDALVQKYALIFIGVSPAMLAGM
jgi:hypothetical protein